MKPVSIGFSHPNLPQGSQRFNRLLTNFSTLVPDAKILFLIQNNDPDVVSAALSNGARAYLLKVDISRELVLRSRAVVAQEQ
jgi:DNA-binding NarL/FixJ family response regulator